MAKDRKTRLRPLQQTAQLQTGGLPSITSYQPKAAPQGKSNEAQMANALAQLAPSLTEFLGTKFQSDKKAGIAKGRQQFFQDTTSERQQRKFNIFAGKLDEDEFFVEGYQRSWLRNLGRSYGLGLTQTVDKLDKTSSDEEFNEALDKYTQEFRSRNGINLYQDEFINEEFLPQQEQFKNVVQQAFSAQKLQFIREQRDASFSIEIGNKFSDLDDRLSNIGVQNVGVNSLGDLLNNKEDLITNFNNLAGTNFTKDTPVSELYSAATQHLQIVLKDAGVEDFTAFNQDVSRYDEFIEDEDTRKFIKNVNALTELQKTQLEVNQLVNDYITQTGDPRKGNKLAAESIAEYAFKELDEDVVDLIDMIQTPGGAWGNTEEGMAIKRQMKERIQNEVAEIETGKAKARENLRKNKIRYYESNVAKILQGVHPLGNQKVDLTKGPDGTFTNSTTRKLIQDQIDQLSIIDPHKGEALRGYVTKYSDQKQESIKSIIEFRAGRGELSDDEITMYYPSTGATPTEVNKLLEMNKDRKYRERVFQRGSIAKMALDRGLSLFGVSLDPNQDIFSQIQTALGNSDKLEDSKEKAKQAIDFYSSIKSFAESERAKLKLEKGNLSENDLTQLDFKVRDFIESKISKIESINKDSPVSVLTEHGMVLKDDEGKFNINGPKDAFRKIIAFDKKYKDKEVIKDGWLWSDLNGFEKMVYRLYMGEAGPQYNDYEKDLDKSFNFVADLLLKKFGAKTLEELNGRN